MKYMIMVYGSQQDYAAMGGAPSAEAAWSAADLEAMGEFMASLGADLTASGELLETRGLAAPARARRIQVVDGAPVVTDGPYPETTEVLAGYWIVECDAERATEIATRLLGSPGPGGGAEHSVVDIRPLIDSRDELRG